MMELGSSIQRALSSVGVTEERVEQWLGAPCNCKERIEKLNRLGAWAWRISAGKVVKAADYLNEILEEQ